jgi:hypothetical protein
MPPQSQAAPPAPASLTHVQRSGPEWRVAGLGGAFTPDLAERYDVLDAQVDDLPELTRYSELFTTLGGYIDRGVGSSFFPTVGARQLKLLDLLSVRWFYNSQPAATIPRPLRVFSAHPGDVLFENPAALPRAFVAYGSRSASSLASDLRQVAFLPTRALYTAPVIEGAAGRSPPLPPTPAVFKRDEATQVDLSVDAARPGWLVLADTYFPGWSATVNGEVATIRAANVAFRAVAVPAGRDQIEFRYSPTREIAAAWISVAVLVGGLAVLVSLYLRGRRLDS